jgi:hypothetical protein
MGGVPPSDDRSQLDGAARGVHLGAVNDSTPVEDGVVSGLVKVVGQCFEDGKHTHVFWAAVVVGEGQSEELVTQEVGAMALPRSEPRTPQCGKGPMNGRLRAVDRARQRVEADACGVSREFCKHGEDAIRPHQPIRVGGFLLPKIGGSLDHVPHITHTFRQMESSSHA